MEKADIGLIGLGVMGQNLALNLANKGWKVCSMEPYRSWKRRKCSGTLYSQPRQRKRHHRQ